MKKNWFSIIMLAVFVSAGISFFSCNHSAQTAEQKNQGADSAKAGADSAMLKQYAHSELKTNWKKSSIPVDSIHDGGVGKNDIPAIDYPEFITAEQAHSFITDPDYGIILDLRGEQKFYPFNILNWHEIVNDVVAGEPVLVSFCPLCGSAIVYDRVVDKDTFLFGVSGKLYESNLLMFDENTESLWSQATGECVVGDLTGKKLPLVNSAVISYEEVQKYFPNAKVLSPKTGFDRNYSEYPYADYNSMDDLYFPVSKKSARYKNKDMMYIVQIGNTSVAFKWENLLKSGSANQKTADGTVEVKVKNFIPMAVGQENNSQLNGYFTYWFSWYAVHGDKGVVWSGGK